MGKSIDQALNVTVTPQGQGNIIPTPIPQEADNP
jgi:hypothetical protein